MKFQPAWCCYPRGLEPSRRCFLKTLATAATASALAPQTDALGRQETTDPKEAPEIPGAFPPGAIRLNFNENPLGPSPKAIAAVLENRLPGSHRYNDIFPLVETLARHHSVTGKEVLVGCGSTEFLHIAPWTFLEKAHNLVIPEPSYGWSAGVASSMGAGVTRVPVDRSGRVDTAALRRAFDGNTRLVYIANPNNPTGASLTYDEVKSLVETLPDQAVLLCDEAYDPFLPDGGSAIKLVQQGAPVVVTRTFSKAYGLAGLRLGYAIAPEAIIEKLKTYWMWDLGINAAVNLAAPAALADQVHVERYIATVDQGLETIRSGLTELGLKPLSHRAPFLMVDLDREAKPVVDGLEAKRVYVQDGNAWNMPTYLRVTVGRDFENAAFLNALRQVL